MPTENNRLLVVDNLGKSFSGERVITGLSFSVQAGEIFGLVGPDGAGKTTTLRLLAGVLKPDQGHVFVNGQPGKNNQIGYLSQNFSLYPDLTVRENIDFFGSIYGMPRQELDVARDRLLQAVGLAEVKGRLAGQLSGGMKQKLSLVCALVHDAILLLLDEPTTAVDPLSRQEFWSIIGDLADHGTAIVVSTQYMEEAELCGRVGLLSGGKLLGVGTPAELRNNSGLVILELPFRGDSRKAVEQAAAKLPGALEVVGYGASVHVSLSPGARSLYNNMRSIEEILSGVGLTGVVPRITGPSLEDVFVDLLGETSREADKNGPGC
ncbi:MAG: ABC transporter ATP-binding protein [Bacillota bacterium]